MMEYQLWLTRTWRSVKLNDLEKYRNRLIALFCVALLLLATFVLSKPAVLPNLAQGSNAKTADFNLHWAKGDMIVLVRHVERCDHSAAPCLVGTEGITARGKRVAEHIGLQFQKLGLERADIYSSPVTRAAQTSTFMFNYASVDQGWLSNCRKNILSDALQHKVNNRNLILVTHSECISQFEKDINLPGLPTADYGSSLFITLNEEGQAPRALGFIDADDWSSVRRY